MKEIKVVINELTDEDSVIYYSGYIELFSSINSESGSLDMCKMDIMKVFQVDLCFEEKLNLSIFPDFVPEEFEIECGLYSEKDLKDDGMYKFIYEYKFNYVEC